MSRHERGDETEAGTGAVSHAELQCCCSDIPVTETQTDTAKKVKLLLKLILKRFPIPIGLLST